MGQTRKTVIGITPQYHNGLSVAKMREGYLLRRTYTDVLARVGAVPLILNFDMPISYVLEICDGVVISGGEDINPAYYGGKSLVYPEEPRVRSEWEFSLIAACESKSIPILGICYGMQLLAVAHGGTLHQNIAVEIPEAISHYDPAYNRSIRHKVEFEEDFLGFQKGTRPWVASRHHQAVARLPEDFVAVAYASDGVLEAMRGPGCFGMQWHPESDETGAEVYRSFVEACRT